MKEVITGIILIGIAAYFAAEQLLINSRTITSFIASQPIGKIVAIAFLIVFATVIFLVEKKSR